MFPLKGKKRLFWVLGLTLLVVAGVALSASKAGITAEVTQVARGQVRQYVEDTAQAAARDQQTLFIEGSGKVLAVYADVGDRVHKGQLLLTLDKTDLQLQLKDAEAKIAAAQAQLKGSQISSYSTRIQIAETNLEQVQVVYSGAERDYNNTKELYASQAVSKKDLEAAFEDYKKAQASLTSAKLELAELKKGTPGYVKSGYSSQLTQALTYRESLLKSLQRQEIRANMDGVVLERLVGENALAGPATAAFVIGTVNHLELETDILADDISNVKLGNDVEISGKALGDRVLTGKVVKIAPAARTIASNLGINQKRVPVTIELKGAAAGLKPGYTVDIKIITASKSGVLRVPDSAVFEYQGKSSVFLVKDGKCVLRPVQKGIHGGDFTEISDGLRSGDTILVKPDNTIQEGTKIKPVPGKGEGSGNSVH